MHSFKEGLVRVDSCLLPKSSSRLEQRRTHLELLVEAAPLVAGRLVDDELCRSLDLPTRDGLVERCSTCLDEHVLAATTEAFCFSHRQTVYTVNQWPRYTKTHERRGPAQRCVRQNNATIDSTDSVLSKGNLPPRMQLRSWPLHSFKSATFLQQVNNGLPLLSFSKNVLFTGLIYDLLSQNIADTTCSTFVKGSLHSFSTRPKIQRIAL